VYVNNILKHLREFNFGDFEVDIEKHPAGVFFREGGEKCSCQKGFRALRVQFSRATFSKAELAAGGSEQLRCSTLDPRRFRESGQSF
jgi:hypothetical protein